MRRYETIAILDPDLKEDQRETVYQKIRENIDEMDGFLVEWDEWGNKKLAYEIKKKPRGHYVRIDYCGAGALVDEMERNFQINDRVMKYMTILTDENADLEQIKADKAAEEEKAVAAEKAATAEEAAQAEKAAAEAPAEAAEEAAEETVEAPAEPAESAPSAEASESESTPTTPVEEA